jgi:hypothetical protein
MLPSIVVTLIITVALGHGLRSGDRGQMILRRPYTNRYNDAAGAREDALLQDALLR